MHYTSFDELAILEHGKCGSENNKFQCGGNVILGHATVRAISVDEQGYTIPFSGTTKKPLSSIVQCTESDVHNSRCLV